MPITDAQARAGLDEFKRRWPQVSPSLDLIRAVLEAAERAAWNPMGTAPWDGTHILAIDEDGHMFRAAFDAEGECWMTYCGQPAVYSPDPCAWRPIPVHPDADPMRPFPVPPEARDE